MRRNEVVVHVNPPLAGGRARRGNPTRCQQCKDSGNDVAARYFDRHTCGVALHAVLPLLMHEHHRRASRQYGQLACVNRPPSTQIVWPVMNSAAGVARNKATAETSAGVRQQTPPDRVHAVASGTISSSLPSLS